MSFTRQFCYTIDVCGSHPGNSPVAGYSEESMIGSIAARPARPMVGVADDERLAGRMSSLCENVEMENGW